MPVLFLLPLIFFCGESISEATVKELSVCGRVIIPSLFPFMILSNLIVESGIGDDLGRIFALPAKKLFGISGVGTCAVFLGAFCGFPIGAKTAVSLYEKGKISKAEAERLLCFCNNTGPGFLINGIGLSLMGSKRLGIMLYAAQIISSLIIGISMNIFSKKKFGSSETFADVSDGEKSAFAVLCEAISSSAASVINVCAYVIFFSVISSSLSEIIAKFCNFPLISAFICGITEISSGAAASANLHSLGYGFTFSAVWCALFIGWSGFSVHAQIGSLCAKDKISLAPYLLSKIVHGILCAAIMRVLLFIIGESAAAAFKFDNIHINSSANIFIYAVNFALIFVLILRISKIIIKKCKKI